jgi:hypothetical protein
LVSLAGDGPPGSPNSSSAHLVCSAGDRGSTAGSLSRACQAGRDRHVAFAALIPRSKTRTPYATHREEQRAERA